MRAGRCRCRVASRGCRDGGSSLPPARSELRIIATSDTVDVRRFVAFSSSIEHYSLAACASGAEAIGNVAALNTKCVGRVSGEEYEIQFGKLHRRRRSSEDRCSGKNEKWRGSDASPKASARRSQSEDAEMQMIMRSDLQQTRSSIRRSRQRVVCTDGMGTKTAEFPLNDAGFMSRNKDEGCSRATNSVLDSLSDHSLRKIFQFLGKPSRLLPLLVSHKAFYRKLEEETFSSCCILHSLCTDIELGRVWRKASPENMRKWLKLLGPFRSIVLSADFTAIFAPTSDEVSTLLESSLSTLEYLSIEVDERFCDCSSEQPDNSAQGQNDGCGRAYEKLIVSEVLGEPVVPYKSSIGDRHALFHDAMQQDVKFSRELRWKGKLQKARWKKEGIVKESEALARLKLPRLKEIVLALGPWSNELQTLFDRIFSFLGEVRLLQWCRMLAQLDLSSVQSLSVNWGALDWLPTALSTPADQFTPRGRTAQEFDGTFALFLDRLSDLRVIRFLTQIRHPRTPEWHQRCVRSFAPFWAAVLVACASSLEEIHVRASPALGAALRKAACLENFYSRVRPAIVCPNLRVFSSYPAPSQAFELHEVSDFLRQVLQDERVAVREMQPVWQYDRAEVVSRE